MDLQVLRVFRAIAVEGGVARAAERLHCVQSNVSARLAQLEENLGTLLFQRQGRKMVITPAGMKLLRYAERLLDLAEEAKDAVMAERMPVERLRVGSIVVAAGTYLPPLLARYHSEHPAVTLDIKLGAPEQIVSELLTRKIDVGLVAGPVTEPALESEELFQEEMVLVTDLSQRRVASCDDINGKAIIVLRNGCTYRAILEGWFSEQGVRISRTLEVDRIEAILNLVAAGIGVAVMPRSIVDQRGLGSSVRCHALPSKYADIRISVAWPRDGLLFPARRAFIAVTREQKYRH
jgi:DNA-binding transcriptional LysR family regulator